MGRGNMIGKPNLPATTSAGGVWGLREQYTANRASEWPGYDPQWSKTTLLLKTEAGVTSTDSRAYSTYGTPTISSSGGPYAGFGSVTIDTGSAQESVYVSDAAMAIGNGNFTVEAWVKVNSYTGGVIATSRWTATQSNIYWLMYVGSTGRPCFVTRSNSFYTDFGANSTTNTVPLNTWTHWAGVREGGVLKLYINGVLQNVTQSDGGVDLTEQAVSIGFFNYSGYTAGSNTTISGFRLTKSAVYTANFTPSTTKPTALTNNVLLLNFDGSPGTASDLTGKNTFTLTGSTVSTPVKFGTTALSLSGSTSAIAAASAGNTLAGNFDFGTGDFCVEAWIYPTAVTGADRVIWDTRSASGDAGMAWFINTNGKLSNYTSNAIRLTSTPALVANVWQHIAVVRVAGVLAYYINGQPAGAVAYTTAITCPGSGRIGIRNDNAAGFVGTLQEFKVTKGDGRYTGAFTPPTTAFDRDWEPAYNDDFTPSNALMVKTIDLPGVTNNIFRDDSTNNFTVAKFGDTAQGTLSPFYPTGYWSTYFDGTGDWLSAPNAAANITNQNYTAEAWVWFTTNTIGYQPIFGNTGTGDAHGWILITETNNFLYAYHSASGGAWNYNIATSYQPKVGAWTHLALVRNGTTVTLYANGASIGSTSIGTNSVQSPSGAFYAGYYPFFPGGARSLAGHISNLRLVIGTAVYTANFTPPTSPLTAIANTSLLICQDNRFIDRSTNAHTITRGGDAAVSRFDPFPLPVPVATIGTASPHGSVFFDGTGDTLTFASNAAYQGGSGDWTIEAWIYTQTATGTIYADRTGGDFTGMVWTVINNKLGLLVNLGGGWNINTYSSQQGNSVPLNQWCHVAVSRQGSTWRAFIDGVLSYTVTGAGTMVQSNGTIGNDPGGSGFFTGNISNFRITKAAVYTANFTPPTAPLTAIANTGILTCQSPATISDASTNNFTITRNGDARASNLNPFQSNAKLANYTYGGSGYFDGTGDYLSGSSSSQAFGFGTGDYTVEAWISPGTGSGSQCIVGGSSGCFAFRLGSSYGGYLTGLQVTRSQVADYDNCSFAFTPGQWYHIAVTRQSGVVRFFINGALQTTGNTANSGYNWPNETAFTVGTAATGAGNETYTGYISNVRVVKGSAAYTASFTPSTGPLTAISGTSLLLNFDNAGVYDAAGVNVLGTAGSSRSEGTIRKYDFDSLAFDGTSGGFVNVPHPAPHLALGTGDFCIEFWAYRTVSAQQIFYGHRPTSTQGVYPTIYCEGATLNYYVSTGNRIAGTTLATGQWYHIAVCRAAAQTRMFVDGVQVGATYADTNNYLNPTARPMIGNNDFGNGTTDYRFTGYIEGLRVSRTARYVTNFTVPAASLPEN